MVSLLLPFPLILPLCLFFSISLSHLPFLFILSLSLSLALSLPGICMYAPRLSLSPRYNPVGEVHGRPVYLREDKNRWLFWKPIPKMDKQGVECWSACGGKHGPCPRFCGSRGRCCRQGVGEADGCGLADLGDGNTGCSGFNCCTFTGNWCMGIGLRDAYSMHYTYLL